MTPKEWLALFAFYAAYLFFGASVFYHNEHALETDRRADELAERIEMNEQSSPGWPSKKRVNLHRRRRRIKFMLITAAQTNKETRNHHHPSNPAREGCRYYGSELRGGSTPVPTRSGSVQHADLTAATAATGSARKWPRSLL